MKKKLHIEFLRIIAAFFVIFNHTGGMGFELYALYPVGSIQYCIMLFLSVACKVAVPLFLMISGGLLLSKKLSLKEIWLVRIPRIAVVLVITSFLYYLFSIKDNFSSFDFFIFMKRLYTNGHSTHLWYLYAYIAFLMCQPILYFLAKNFSKTHFLYLIILYVIFSMIPIVDEKILKVSITSKINPSFLWDDILLFPLIGYYLEHHLNMEAISARHKIAALLSGFAVWVLACLLTHMHFRAQGDTTQSYHSLLVLIPSIAIYVVTKDFFFKRSVGNLLEKAIILTGTATFGVYLMHLLVPFRDDLVDFLYKTLNFPLPVVSACYCVIIFIVCAAITLIFKKIPGIKKLL